LKDSFKELQDAIDAYEDVSRYTPKQESRAFSRVVLSADRNLGALGEVLQAEHRMRSFETSLDLKKFNVCGKEIDRESTEMHAVLKVITNNHDKERPAAERARLARQAADLLAQQKSFVTVVMSCYCFAYRDCVHENRLDKPGS
jgi:hypothetical protein